MNYLQNKYNMFRRLLKTSLYYRVKHKSLKMLQLLYYSLITKLSTQSFKKFKQLKTYYFTLLYFTLLPCPAAHVPVTSSRS